MVSFNSSSRGKNACLLGKTFVYRRLEDIIARIGLTSGLGAPARARKNKSYF